MTPPTPQQQGSLSLVLVYIYEILIDVPITKMDGRVCARRASRRRPGSFGHPIPRRASANNKKEQQQLHPHHFNPCRGAFPSIDTHITRTGGQSDAEHQVPGVFICLELFFLTFFYYFVVNRSSSALYLISVHTRERERTTISICIERERKRGSSGKHNEGRKKKIFIRTRIRERG